MFYALLASVAFWAALALLMWNPLLLPLEAALVIALAVIRLVRSNPDWPLY